jgi:hypothetical protein
MSLLKTKPRYCPDAIATQSGWIHPITKELLVSVGNLKAMLEKEQPEEVKMDNTNETNLEATPSRRGRPKGSTNKPKIIGEVVERDPNVKILGEVVEYALDQKVLGE